ncbi:MAG: hypothetical protein OXI74_07615 [Rhodospirillaceae bacterium]|nr:hypothetical protein [Rhodospirillaceae bacterium]
MKVFDPAADTVRETVTRRVAWNGLTNVIGYEAFAQAVQETLVSL